MVVSSFYEIVMAIFPAICREVYKWHFALTFRFNGSPQPRDGMLLLRQVHHPEAPFPEDAQQLVASDVAADLIQGLDSIQGPRGILIRLSDMVIVPAHKNSPAISPFRMPILL